MCYNINTLNMLLIHNFRPQISFLFFLMAVPIRGGGVKALPSRKKECLFFILLPIKNKKITLDNLPTYHVKVCLRYFTGLQYFKK